MTVPALQILSPPRKPGEKVNILLIGDSGTHKTFFCGTAPNVLIYDFDLKSKTAVAAGAKPENIVTFRDASRHWPAARVKALGMTPYATGWGAFTRHLDSIGEMIDKGTCPYHTICLDSLTFLAELAMNAVLQAEKNNPDHLPHQGSYGTQQRYIMRVLNDLTAFPTNLICTAHVQRDENAVTGIVEKLPLITGKLAGRLPGYFQEVYFTDVEGEGATRKYLLRTGSTPMMRQALSTNNVPDKTEATWQAIEKYVRPA
jgi:hypothetical protein